MNQQPNRAQRRAMQRIKHMPSERVVPLPALLDEFTIFDIPQRIFDQLSNGQIDSVDDVPVFRDNTGQWCEVVPALDGWVFTWEKIAKELNLSLIAFTSMRILISKLNSGATLSVIDIAAANCELTQCRGIFRKADRTRLMEIAKTAQLQILLGQ